MSGGKGSISRISHNRGTPSQGGVTAHPLNPNVLTRSQRYTQGDKVKQVTETVSPDRNITKKVTMSPKSRSKTVVEEEVTEIHPPRVKVATVTGRANVNQEAITTKTTKVTGTNPKMPYGTNYNIERNYGVLQQQPGQVIEAVTHSDRGGMGPVRTYVNTTYKPPIAPIKGKPDRLPDLSYDSPSRYSQEKSPTYSPRRQKPIDPSRPVYHDLSGMPVPQQVGPLDDVTKKLLFSTLTELLRDFRVLEKARIDLSLRTDFNVR
jgi:hypothetical protein